MANNIHSEPGSVNKHSCDYSGQMCPQCGEPIDRFITGIYRINGHIYCSAQCAVDAKEPNVLTYFNGKSAAPNFKKPT